MNDRPITATALEQEVDAFIATLSAWCYPSDVEVRYTALEACALLGIDYVESIANIMETTNADAHSARYLLATGFAARIAAEREKGAVPRTGILATGKQADSLGRSVESYNDEDQFDADGDYA